MTQIVSLVGNQQRTILKPEDLRLTASQHTQVVVIFVLGDDGKAVQPSMVLYLIVVRAIQRQRLHMAGAGEQVGRSYNQLG